MRQVEKDYIDAHGPFTTDPVNLDAPVSREVMEALGFRGRFYQGNPEHPNWEFSVGDMRMHWAEPWKRAHPTARELIELIRKDAKREERHRMQSEFRELMGIHQ